METQKQRMSLANMQGKLSRTEMKNIIAGYAPPECYSGVDCYLNQAACVFSGHSGKARPCGNNDFCCCC